MHVRVQLYTYCSVHVRPVHVLYINNYLRTLYYLRTFVRKYFRTKVRKYFRTKVRKYFRTYESTKVRKYLSVQLKEGYNYMYNVLYLKAVHTIVRKYFRTEVLSYFLCTKVLSL